MQFCVTAYSHLLIYHKKHHPQAIHLKYFIYFTGSTVDEFLRFYCEAFPSATVTPKLHMLEDHVVAWMHQW